MPRRETTTQQAAKLAAKPGRGDVPRWSTDAGDRFGDAVVHQNAEPVGGPAAGDRAHSDRGAQHAATRKTAKSRWPKRIQVVWRNTCAAR